MAGERSPAQLPPAKRRKKSSPTTTSSTTIHSLTDDLLLRIFLRLPSLATLVRAALACRPWCRAVASSPAFRRRFRELHPAPLLGLFFGPPTAVQDPLLPAFPSFVPARRRDRDLGAALRGGDFFLTSIQEHPDKAHSWDILDCRGGYVLLCNGDQFSAQAMAVVNPLARQSQRFFDDSPKDASEGCRGTPVERSACLLCSDEDPTSFRVVALTHDESRVRATVFSSDTGEWKIHPWVDVPGRPRRSKVWLLNGNMQSNGFLYWVYKNHKYIITLNTATMRFSVEELPQFLKNRCCSFDVGETNSGERCIVYAVDFTIGVMLRRTDSDGVEKWMLYRATPLDTQLDGVLRKLKGNYNELLVVAVRDGFAYLATSKNVYDPQNPSWFLSLCLETMKLENLFQRPYNSGGHPYVMAWPPCLVRNYGRLALEDGT
ncbi:hypothetical protein SEVIR_5G224000v4 [Setaria viridis]|uniref:F-box domain-containing protein n=2 Tax=Setaria TaxID=4554 RepID=K3XQ05_SETIT|nr:uncharacterized protein LOC101770442 [Setaria italica]XP_034593095.1 uncharacterized protein LOC117854942 [Setaria viridis]RCV26085.1 hypothetical protein SETIT_5G217300v2 [Setaria italica]TKW15235.1 hypothetical protein SEVIR_5G224000v2 [Setaria viridis]